MKIYHNQNVLDAALDRIRWVFDEFPNVVVNYSGGKDSTVIFNLALQVAREKGRLPLKVMFLDQEAEWQATIDQVERVMTDPDVEPWWFQMPLKLFNATSTEEHWLQCWDPAAEDRWMRPKWDGPALTENVYGTDRFTELFTNILAHHFPDQKACYLTGVRCEESPSRTLGLTHYPTYKGRTWGKVESHRTEQYSLHPIYDWSYTDVWKAIHEHGWPYNAIYDAQYRYGVKLQNMRVSNVHHETAVHSLFYMQEMEPETYHRLTSRVAGIDAAAKMGTRDYFVYDLPFMFANWREYRDFLLEKLIDNPEWKAGFKATFARMDAIYGEAHGDQLWKVHVNSILTNDWEHIKLVAFERGAGYLTRKRVVLGQEGGKWQAMK